MAFIGGGYEVITAADLERIYFETYRAGPWNLPERRIVQRELLDACWTAVLGAARKHYETELERLREENRTLKDAMLKAIEADAHG